MSPCHTEAGVGRVPLTTGNITGMIKFTYRIPWIKDCTFEPCHEKTNISHYAKKKA